MACFTSPLGSAGQSSIVRRRAYVLLAAHHTPPNKWDIILYCFTKPSTIHKKRKALRSRGGTFTCVYIACTSAMIANLCCRNLNNTWISLLTKSGPWKHWLFKLIPANLAAQSCTILTLPGRDSLITGWCGRNQTEPSDKSRSHSGTGSA